VARQQQGLAEHTFSDIDQPMKAIHPGAFLETVTKSKGPKKKRCRSVISAAEWGTL
jgi:hypothetical protein